MSHNPYTPPSAPIEDIGPAAPPTPWQVKVAVWLIWVSLTISAVFYALGPDDPDLASMGESILLTVVLISVGVALVVMGLLSFFILRAHRWARIVYAAMVVLALIRTFREMNDVFQLSSIEGAFVFVSIVVDVTSAALLFTPPANAWVANRRAAAQA